MLEWLGGSTALRRLEYPTRELLVVRTAAESLEVLGIAIVLLTAPAAAPTAVGFVLVLLGGRSGVGRARSVLGERLHRTPADDDTRERWLRREYRAVVAVLVPVLVVTLVGWLS